MRQSRPKRLKFVGIRGQLAFGNRKNEILGGGWLSKCSCPIWCDGELNGKRYRHTLETRDWQRAELRGYCGRARVHDVAELNVQHLDAYCDAIGRGPYERLRARAMVLLPDNTALRISDIATLARDRVQDGRMVLRTLKTGQVVSLPIWPLTQLALDALPAPRGADAEPRCYFWNGITSKRAVVGIAERTLAAVFRASGVHGAHAHRFRHTLATRLLGAGGREQEVADILGNSPAIVRKHYAKWSHARQERIDRLMQASANGTSVVDNGKSPVVN